MSLHNAMQINQTSNLLSSDSQQWQGIKQTTVGGVFGFGSEPGARGEELRREGGCVVEMLICYSVCPWRDEKHSYQIHWRRGILERGLVLLPVGMAAESCLTAHRQDCSQRGIYALCL